MPKHTTVNRPVRTSKGTLPRPVTVVSLDDLVDGVVGGAVSGVVGGALPEQRDAADPAVDEVDDEARREGPGAAPTR